MQFDKVRKFILAKLHRDLPEHLTYHSVGHVKDVYTAAENLAKMEKVDGENLLLLLTAVLFHDSGFIYHQQDHELVSCDIAKLYLPEFGYSAEQIDIICGMIMATRFPQAPGSKLEKIICDADLDYLGRDDFYEIANRLYEELCIYGLITNKQDWFKMQSHFFATHHYFTPSARKLRKAKKDEHLKHIKSIIKNKSFAWDSIPQGD